MPDASGAGSLMRDVKLGKSMPRTFFFLLAGAFCLAAGCFPVRSKISGSWADVTFAIGCEDYGSGIWYDRQFDFPTGGLFVDVPVWAVDTGLLATAAIAFGFHAKRELQKQKV
jgi:hypothetical protein